MDKLENAIASLREESHRLFMETMKLARAQRTWDETERMDKAAWDAAALLDAAWQRVTGEREVAHVATRVALHRRMVADVVQRVGTSEASRRALWAADFALGLAEKVTKAPQPQDDGPWAA